MTVAGVRSPYPGSAWKARLVLAFWLLFALAAIFGHVRAPEDFGNYIGAGRVVLNSGDIYSYAPNTWPPFFSVLCVPLALLAGVSPYAAVVFWSFLNCAALLLLCDIGARLAYGQGLALTLSGSSGVLLKEPAIFLPVLFTLPYLIDNFQFHQINLVIFLMF